MKPILAMSLAVVLGGCAASTVDLDLPFGFFGKGRPETQPLTADIAPVESPVLRRLRSMQVQSLLDGEPDRLRISRAGNGIRVREPDGCVWTRSHDWFAPSDSFARCGTSKNWHTAKARVRREGSLFPLRVGNTATYERRAVSWNGKRSTRRSCCVVEDSVEVLRPGQAATPAYVVVCDDGRVRRTTWYSPRIGPVAYHEIDDENRVRDAWVRID
ncbi:MAG: hypothetical protein AAF409_18470 [Pseudomonadota bacterium]